MCSLAAQLVSFIPDDSSLLEGSSIHSFGIFSILFMKLQLTMIWQALTYSRQMFQ